MNVRRLKNNQGFVMAFSLLVMTVFVIFGAIFVLRAVNEWAAVTHQRMAVEALYLAEAAADSALDMTDELINSFMMDFLGTKAPQKVINKCNSYVNSGKGLDFLEWGVKGKKDNKYVSLLTLDDDEQTLVYSLDDGISLGTGSYDYRIEISEKGAPVAVSTDVWDFPFYYKIEATGISDVVSKNIILMGDFTVRVQRDNFAKYALFSDHHSMKSGTRVWFTDSTLFAGPLHTNDQYNFYGNPAGTFDGLVTQHLNKAQFYNNGWTVQLDADANGSTDVPIFNSGFTRGYDEIVLASSVQKQDLIDQTLADASAPGSGILVPTESGSVTGGIFVDGNATISMAVDGDDNARYTIVQGSQTREITVDLDNTQTTVRNPSTGEEDTYSGIPDGVDDVGTIIYVDGTVTSLSGNIQKDTQLTVSCENDAVITGNIVYSDFTASSGTIGSEDYVPPTANGTTNLFGIVAWGGDIRIGTTAPDDINIYGVMMARNGVFQVDSYDNQSIGPRGTVTLLGGQITQFYGAFGLFNGSTGNQLSGYGRNYVYDGRMSQGQAPPYFPSMRTFIGFTNDLTDQVMYRSGDV